jgi:hypothetical protein
LHNKSHIHQVDESLIDQIYELPHEEEVLKSKLIRRAENSEYDLQAGKVFIREEIEQRTNKTLRK